MQSENQESFKDELVQHQLFSEIGIEAFSDSIEWLKESVEKYRKSWFKTGLNDVKRDADRLFSTYETGTRAKINTCRIESLDQTKYKNDGSVTPNEIVLNVLNVEDQADNLLKLLRDLKNRNKKRIAEIIDGGTVTENSQTSNGTANRRSGVIRVRGLLPIDKNNKQSRNQSGEELHEGSSSGPNSRMESVPSIENTTPIRNINNQCSQDLPESVVEATIPNFSKILFEQKDIRTVVIGNIPWKLACQCYANSFVFIIICEWDQPNHTCIAESTYQILSHFDPNGSKRWEEVEILQYDDITKRCHHRIDITDLLNPLYGFIKNDTIRIKLNLNILETSGIPTPDSLFLNPSYYLVAGNLTHTFPNVSRLKEDEEILSDSVFFAGYPWKLLINREAIHLLCNLGATIRAWFCYAKVNFSVINGSAKNPRYSRTDALKLEQKHWAYTDFDLSWNKIMREKRNYLHDDCLTLIATVTVFKKKEE